MTPGQEVPRSHRQCLFLPVRCVRSMRQFLKAKDVVCWIMSRDIPVILDLARGMKRDLFQIRRASIVGHFLDVVDLECVFSSSSPEDNPIRSKGRIQVSENHSCSRSCPDFCFAVLGELCLGRSWRRGTSSILQEEVQ